MTRRTIPLGFTPEPATEGLHACFIYSNEEERRQVMARYLQAGLQSHEKVLYLVDVMTPEDLIQCLQELGVDVRSKQCGFNVAEAAPAYCPSGAFNADEMLDTVQRFYHRAIEEGYEGARGTGEMSWCLVEGRASEEALMDYEARLNILLQQHPYTACCQYDANRFDGQTLLDVLNVHPAMIVRGQLMRNPFYVDPSKFLERRRRSAACQ